MNKFMKSAILEAHKGIMAGHGGPFGSVIVKDGKIVAKGHNHVVANNDPTCHGEVDAIRKACKKLKTFDLSGCELYTTGEPCPMCLAAIAWANINKVYYGATLADNEMIGFRDVKIDNMFGGRKELGDFMTCVDRDKCLELFNAYNEIQDKTMY